MLQQVPSAVSGSMASMLSDYTAQISLSKSRQTVEAYAADVSRFLEYTQSKGMKRVASIKGQTIVSYLGQQKALGKSDASLHRYYMSIRSFCRYLRITRVLTEDICLEVSAPMFKMKAPYVPNTEEIKGIIAAVNSDTKSGKRDKAILELLYSSGLRASELCDLELKGPDGEPNHCQMRQTGQDKDCAYHGHGGGGVKGVYSRKRRRAGSVVSNADGKETAAATAE